jgi:UDP-3-O-[3-hydroxymyristoyl] N-acetylglucosamine deacetylase
MSSSQVKNMNQIDKHTYKGARGIGEAVSNPLTRAHGLDLARRQRTLLRSVNCQGVGLHSGRNVSLTLKPAMAGTGIVFRRTDLAGSPEIPARWDHVVDATMCTTIGTANGVRVGTVEHLMAAFAGCHIDNAIVELDGPEVPVMDGSAAPFVFLMDCAGTIEQEGPRRVIEILKPVRVEQGGKVAELLPSDTFTVAFEIDFASGAIARQSVQFELVNGTFNKEVARARTFGFAEEVEKMRAAGLALGGSLDNAVVVEGDKVLNADGLRYQDEFVRHKVLDAVGDLKLADGEIQGAYRGSRAGHMMTNLLLRALFADPTAYCIRGGIEEAAMVAQAPVRSRVAARA